MEIPPAPAVPPNLVPDGPAPQTIRIGVSLLTSAHVFYQDLEASIRETAAKYNAEVTIQSAEFDQARQLRSVQDFVAQGMDALIICPVDTNSVGSTIRLANQATPPIPVFTADIAAASGEVVCHVASDNRKGGELLGRFVAEELLPEGGELAIIDYPTVASVTERVAGFLTAIGVNPAIRVVARPAPVKPEKADAVPVAQNLLLANPKLRVIFGINDDTALGAVQAVKSSGSSVRVVGFDGTPEALNQMRQPNSPLVADVAQYPRVIGEAVVGAIVQHLAGKPVPKQAPIPTGLIRRRSGGG